MSDGIPGDGFETEQDSNSALNLLLSCPFCGGAPALKKIGNEWTKKRAVHICCTTFGCTVEIRVGSIYHDHEWCERKAREKWNKRA